MAERHRLFDNNPNYYSSVLNDEKNPSLFITREELVAKYHLKPHQTVGGQFREIHRSATLVTAVDDTQQPAAPASTTIYYLLTGNEVSPLHRLSSDSTVQFSIGKALVLVILNAETRSYSEFILGNNLQKNEVLSLFIPAQTWFGAYLVTNFEHLSLAERQEKEIADKTENFIVRQKERDDEPKSRTISTEIELLNPDSFDYSFISFTFSPGIDFEQGIIDMGTEQLISEFPAAMDRIRLLTKHSAEKNKI